MLENFRNEIDMLDTQIIEVLGQRFEVCRKVAFFKKEQDIPMMQYGRVEAVKQRCRNLARQHKVNEDFIVEVYNLIITESCRLENEIIDRQDDEIS